MNYNDYLYEMDQKAKAAKASQKFKAGDMVVINLPAGMPNNGKTGRVVSSVINAGASSVCHTLSVDGEAVTVYESHLLPVGK